jgi:hypothetical protein
MSVLSVRYGTYLVPITVARPFSCKAEAKTSAALAVPPLVSIAIGTRGRERERERVRERDREGERESEREVV